MVEDVPPPSDADAPPGDVVSFPSKRREPRAPKGEARTELPNALNAERSLLGGILIQPQVLDELGWLEVDHFYDPRNKAVFAAMRNLEAKGEPLDVVSLEVEIDRAGKLGAVGGVAYLGELALNVPTPENVVYYAQVVREKWASRTAMLRAAEFMREVERGHVSADDAAAELVGELERLRAAAAPAQSGWDREVAAARADVRKALGMGYGCQTTREPLFDRDGVDLLQADFPDTTWLVTGLITKGGVAIIGAEPKTTKTWLGTEIGLAVATGTPVCGEFYAQHGSVAYFYAEDLDRQVRNRERALLAGANRTLERGRFHLCPRGKFLDLVRDEDVALVVASARRLGRVDLLVLDPLRDISSASEDKSDEMGPVMRRLRLIGDLLDCTVVVVHHASKVTGDTAKRRPGQRLRGSGAIHGSVDAGLYLSDLDSDDPNVFRNTVESEIRGARSAGMFALTLTVEDDENGEAIRARWTVERTSKGEQRSQSTARETSDLKAKIVALFKAAGPAGIESATQVVKTIGGRKQSVLAVVNQMIGCELAYRDGRLVLVEGGSP